MAQLAAGRLDDAFSLARRAVQAANAQGEKGHEAWALFAQGSIEARMGNAQQAEASCRTALAIAAERGMRPLAAQCRARLGAGLDG